MVTEDGTRPDWRTQSSIPKLTLDRSSELYRVGQKSVGKRLVVYLRRDLYFRAVALQIVYCTFLFEDSVVKIWKFEYFRPCPFNIKTPTLFSLNMLDA